MMEALDIEQLRRRQEQRLTPALDAWNEAKKLLASAIELAETREREYRAVADDVRRKLEALDVVIAMSVDPDVAAVERRLSAAVPGPPESGTVSVKMIAGESPEQPVETRITTAGSNGSGGLAVRSSRQLFTASVRSKYARLSILQ
jgi:hypothetical protein